VRFYFLSCECERDESNEPTGRRIWTRKRYTVGGNISAGTPNLLVWYHWETTISEYRRESAYPQFGIAY
jgi:hypothetical protein